MLETFRKGRVLAPLNKDCAPYRWIKGVRKSKIGNFISGCITIPKIIDNRSINGFRFVNAFGGKIEFGDFNIKFGI